MQHSRWAQAKQGIYALVSRIGTKKSGNTNIATYGKGDGLSINLYVKTETGYQNPVAIAAKQENNEIIIIINGQEMYRQRSRQNVKMRT